MLREELLPSDLLSGLDLEAKLSTFFSTSDVDLRTVVASGRRALWNVFATVKVRDDYDAAIEQQETRASALEMFLNVDISSEASLAVSQMGYTCGTCNCS